VSHPAEERLELNIDLTGAEVERLVLVGGDLEFLLGLPRDRLLTHTEVRLAAGVMRRLFVDDQISLVWRSLAPPRGYKLAVEGADIDATLKNWPAGWVRYAWAGGATTSLAHHKGLFLAAVPKAKWEPYGSETAFFEANPLPHRIERRLMATSEWLRGTAVAIQTGAGLVRISREAVLKYIANRKGGVHFNPDREPPAADNKKRMARRQIEWNLLDHGLLRVGHLSGPEYEVNSMVHAIATSAWAANLAQIARRTAPEDFEGNPDELKMWTGLKEADGTGWATTTFAPKTPPAPLAE
jgi:hypothetical protein